MCFAGRKIDRGAQSGADKMIMGIMTTIIDNNNSLDD